MKNQNMPDLLNVGCDDDWAKDRWYHQLLDKAAFLGVSVVVHDPVGDECADQLVVGKITEMEFDSYDGMYNYGVQGRNPQNFGSFCGAEIKTVRVGPNVLEVDMVNYNYPALMADLKKVQHGI